MQLTLTEVISIVASAVLIANAINVWRKHKTETDSVIAQASRMSVETMLETIKQVAQERDEFETKYNSTWICAWVLVKQVRRLGGVPDCRPDGHEPETGPLKVGTGQT